MLAGSPAINNATGAGATAIDQRGFTKVLVRDSGAYEFDAFDPVLGLDLTVTSILDDNGVGCTLREAVSTVNARGDIGNGCFALGAMGTVDTINFGPAVAGQTITTTQGELPIYNSVSINPGGVNTTIDANGVGRVIKIGQYSTVTLDQLTITGGNISGPGAHGGGIFTANSSPVTITNSIISGNTTTSEGGGIYAAIFSPVTLTNSTVSGNTSAQGGGGISGSSNITLTNSTVSGNSAHLGGGFDILDSSVTLTNSTVSGNSAQLGGGIFANTFSSFILSNSTVSSNSASINGGGIYAFQSSVTLNNTTVSGNSSAATGGIVAGEAAGITLSNSIVANPGFVDCETYIGVDPATLVVGSDTISTSGCDGATVADPLLDPLADNGGPTLTHALLTGSPAINNATAAGATTFDQRGFMTVGVRDSGAFEFSAFDPAIGLDLTVTSVLDDNGAGCTLREAVSTLNAKERSWQWMFCTRRYGFC